MLKGRDNQLSIYSVLYNRIPENHLLKRINKAVDFSFINKLLEKSYCKYYGRPAKEPELMIKILLLKQLYNLSDEKIIEEIGVNLAFMWFLGLNPDDELPHPSLLAKFRVHRIDDATLDDILTEIIRQCKEKGIIKDDGVSIDCTHVSANTIKKVPERVMKHISKEIFKKLEEEAPEVLEKQNTEIPNYKEIEDHKEAKRVMKNYIDGVIENVEEQINPEDHPKTYKLIKEAKEILEDPKFMQQKGVRSLIDKDARVGYKSQTESFFGYKVEYTMTTDSRLILAVRVYPGSYVDGTNFEEILELALRTKVSIKKFFGDKAYFRKIILDAIKKISAKPYIPVSESVYRIDENKYSYNKDSDQWFCECGNYTVKKEKKKRNDGRLFWRYIFNKEICQSCSKRQECIKRKSKAQRLDIGINIPEFYEYSQWTKTKEFQDNYKQRACQEWKNAEMKRFHGLDRAQGYGLLSMSKQAKLTAIAVNLKRIASILSSLNHFIFVLLHKYLFKGRFYSYKKPICT